MRTKKEIAADLRKRGFKRGFSDQVGIHQYRRVVPGCTYLVYIWVLHGAVTKVYVNRQDTRREPGVGTVGSTARTDAGLTRILNDLR